jgi:hypothetical protein
MLIRDDDDDDDDDDDILFLLVIPQMVFLGCWLVALQIPKYLLLYTCVCVAEKKNTQQEERNKRFV